MNTPSDNVKKYFNEAFLLLNSIMRFEGEVSNIQRQLVIEIAKMIQLEHHYQEERNFKLSGGSGGASPRG